MTISPLDSPLFGTLLSDPDLQAIFSDERLISEMIHVERALARAQGRLGVIPVEHAAEIDRALDGLIVPAADLAAGTAADGVPVPALVRALRQAVGGAAAGFVHWGATSQDILDTAAMRQIQSALTILEVRLWDVSQSLGDLADRHRTTIMVARTRMQQATPTTFGLKAATWLAPLTRHRQRLVELRPRAVTAVLGGAVGNLAAMGGRGLDVAAAVARELDLPAAATPWHVQRDGVFEIAAWMAQVSGSLGKIAGDVILLAQNEVGELGLSGGGGSSTMPNKTNPVRCEAIVALARTNAGLIGTLAQAVLHGQERDGAAWTQEWLLLPQMIAGAGACLSGMRTLLGSLSVDTERMAANLAATNGLVLAENASFTLAVHMDRAQAQAVVKSACTAAVATGQHLIDVLRDSIDAPIDWQALRLPQTALGRNDDLIDIILANARATRPT